MQKVKHADNIWIISGGNIFESNMQTLVNPVNTIGTMGAGLAKSFSTKFPDIIPAYVRACKSGMLTTECPQLVKRTGKWVLNFATKQDWRDTSRIEYIKSGMTYIEHNYRDSDIISLAIPALGCGLGNLKWSEVVGVIMNSALRMDIPIEIYSP